MILPGFKGSTNARSIILDVAVKLAFDELEKRYPSTALGTLASISSGGTPSKSSSASYGGSIPWAKIADVTAASKWIESTEETITEQGLTQSSAKLFPANTVLFSMYGSIGKTAITKKPMATNQAILGLIPKNGVSSEYLYYSLINARTKLFLEAKGTSQKNINGGMVKSFRVPMPPPDMAQAVVSYLAAFEQGKNIDTLQNLPPFISEQRRIVGRLEHLASKIEEARGLQKESISEAQALLKSGTNKVLGMVSKESWVELGKYVSRIENGWSPACEQRPAQRNEWGVVKVGCVSFGTFEPTENKALPTSLEPKPEFEIHVDDFLMSRANTSQLVGACAIVESTPPKLLLSDKIFRFHFRDNLPISRSYLNYVLKSPALRMQIGEEASGTSPTMKNISKGKVFKLLIPPHGIDEQNEIVTNLDYLHSRVNHLKQLQGQTRGELDALLPSVLDKAFRGEL